MVAINKELDLDLKEEDFNELLFAHYDELTNEKLIDLEAHRKEKEKKRKR